MNQQQLDIPDAEDNQFWTLGELIEKVSVATLASAIEQDGIYTWDRFGRFGLADKEGKAEALHLLAMHYQWESAPSGDRSTSDHDHRSPMEQWGCSWDNAYSHFGWAAKVAPDFDKILHTQPEVPTIHGVKIKRKAPDTFVVALTKLLVDIAKKDPTLDITQMPGVKADLHALAVKRDADLRCELSTFDTYIGPFCQFKRGARPSGYYRKLFENCSA